MGVEEDISIRISGNTGRITLTRPDALNAMTYEMCMAIGDALTRWQADDAVKLVVIDSEGSRAFCSGGDIGDLYRTGKAGDFDYGRKFWHDEYIVNAQIKNFPKPYVALMDGIVMGGGVGISAHGSHRIVTENTLFAMPECGIGLVPDVGGNLYLSRAPGHTGEFLAATGTRLKAADTIYAGIADFFVPEAKLGQLINVLEDSGDPSAIDDFTADPGTPELKQQHADIQNHFSKESALEIVQCLEQAEGEWAANAAKLMRRNCPLSVACAVEIARKARDCDCVEEILNLEYRFTYRSMSDGDLIEGIRAQIIDKDREPKWQVPRLEDITVEQVTNMLADLGENGIEFAA